ncbi:hypothetical protein P879_06164, partial [Paragonimus westermani]
ILPQLSDSLKNKLFYCAVPSPLLAAGYRQRSCSSDSCEDKLAGSAVGVNLSASLCDLASVYDFGYTGQLYDPVLSDQAAANFLCGKLLGLLRPNAGILHERSANAATVLECLEQLEKLAVMGQDCTTEGDQLAVLSCIQSHLRPEHAESVICSDEDAAANSVIDELSVIENHDEDSEVARQNESTERPLGKRRRKTSKSPSKHRLPLTLEKFLDYDTSTNEHRLLAALDPFVIRLASRSVHPDYRGHGLLCTSDDLLLWSTPHPICSHSVPRLWHNVPDQYTSENQLNPISVDVPGVFLPQTRLCELDVASVKATTNYAVVARWSSPSQGSCTNVQFMQLHISGDSHSSCISHAFRPELPSQSTSVCLNPWLPGEFAAAGHCSKSPGDTLGYVQVYSATGDRNEIPAWSCHIALEDSIDGQLGDHVGTMNAAGFTDITDPVQSSLMTYISSFSTNSWKHIVQSPIGSVTTNFGLRIGYASHPGELCFSTTRRMLLMDTRQTKVAQELFTLSPSPTGPLSRFSMAECLTCSPSKFFGDVYALGATPFSLFMLDKRMPGRTVLHWSHSLLGSPVYLHWCSVDQVIRDVYDLPQFFLSVAAQFPADIGVVGLNVSPPGQASGGPQLVGPSISGSRLTELTLLQITRIRHSYFRIMGTLGGHWRRFVLACINTSPQNIDSGGAQGSLLRKSPSEWQRLNESTRVLLRSCPAGRLAVLDHLTPLFGEYFVFWWQWNQQKTGSTVGDSNGDGLEDGLCSSEPVLIDVISLIRELVMSNAASDEFISGVCSWVLARLRPACVIPPTQMLTTLKRLLNHSARLKATTGCQIDVHGDVDVLTDQLTNGSKLTSVVNGARSPSMSKRPRSRRHTRARESSPSDLTAMTASRTATVATSSSSSSSSGSSDSDTGPELDEQTTGVDSVIAASTNLTGTRSTVSSSELPKLDLSATSLANKQLLGAWSNCRLMVELLQLAYEFFMGSRVRLCTVQALLAIATVPLPPELPTVIEPSISTYTPSPGSVLPHWVIIWLLYQISRQPLYVVSSLRRLTSLLLDAALVFPPPVQNVTLDSSATPETVTGWLIEHRLDVHFWMTSCLTHLLFLGDGVALFVSEWVTQKLTELTSLRSEFIVPSSGRPTGQVSSLSGPSFRSLVCLLLHLGLMSVPTPPSWNPFSCVVATSQSQSSAGIARADPLLCRPPLPPSSGPPVVYGGNTGFNPTPPSQFGANLHNPMGGLYSGGRFGPRQHQLLGRSTTPFPFPGPPPMGILGAPAPGLNNPSSQTHSFSHAGSTSWRRPSFSSARKRARQDEAANRVMSGLDAKSVSTGTAPGRQPTSLVWLLNLSKRIRSAAIAAATNVLVRLTPEQWQQIYAASFSCNLSDGQRLLQLASEVLLTAPVHLCCSAPELEDLSMVVNRSGTSFTNWPTALALFFPILDELEAGWNARLGHGCQVEVKPVHHSHIQQLLSDRFLPRIWALVERNSSKPSAILALSSLIWLITREQWLIRSHSVQPRLLPALRSHLVPMLKLMCADPNSKSFNLLLTLLEFASAVCIRSSASSTRLAKSTTGSVRLGPVRSQTVTLSSGECSSLSHLTPRLSVSISRYSTQLIAKLISRLSVINNSPPDVIINHVRSIRRVENLLIAMSVQRPLVRFTALRCLSDWDTIRTLWNLNTVALTSFPMLRTVNSRSFDSARLVTSPSFLPDDLFEPGLGNQRSQNGNLLLTNPPPVDAMDNLSRGQFLRPNRGELRNRPPGVSGNASGVSSGLIHAERSVQGGLSPKHSLTTHSEWQPVLFHWLYLMKRLVNDATANPFRFAVCWTLCSPEATRENAYLLGARVQSVLLPHGTHIPQASVTHLPNPLALVFPPTGVGLERVLGLVHGFVPEVKAVGANQIRRNPYTTDRAAELAQLWNMILQQPLITECQLFEQQQQQQSTGLVLVSEHSSSDSSQFVADTFPSDPFTRSICTQKPLLPHCKLLLGLLMGLEATWAGPQAPRISIPDAITYLTANAGRHAQGVFP